MEAAGSDHGFFQGPPTLKNQLHDDPSLRRTLQRRFLQSYPLVVLLLTSPSLPAITCHCPSRTRIVGSWRQGSFFEHLRRHHGLREKRAVPSWRWTRCFWPSEKRLPCCEPGMEPSPRFWNTPWVRYCQTSLDHVDRCMHFESNYGFLVWLRTIMTRLLAHTRELPKC